MIVLDEPTSFLDVKYKLELLSILERMAQQKITVIMSLHEIDLAQKISDKIGICVKERDDFTLWKSGEVFTEEIIRELYGINNGFDILTFLEGIELPAPEGEPEVFVISSGGTGIPVYRRLQRSTSRFRRYFI